MKKLISLALACVMMGGLVACGDKDASGTNEGPTNSQPSISILEPEIPPELECAYLTGLEKTAGYPEGKRIVGVMVGNTPTARPAYGLSEAKILVECDANANITRFLALYEDYEKVPTTGSVRSARDPFVQLLIPTYGFFVHEGPGEYQPARLMLEQYEYYGNYDLDSVVWNESAKNNSVFNWYNTDGDTIKNAVERKEYDDTRNYISPFFKFGRYDEAPRVPAEGEATELSVVLTQSFRTSFDYDAATGKYKMSQFNSYTGGVEPTVDANNQQQVQFDNVLVVYAPMDVYPGTEGEGGLTRVDFTQGGGGFYFSQGGYERVIWRKGAPDRPLRLEKTDKSGEPVEVNPGTTYIAVVDDTRAEAFLEQLQQGTAAQHAEGEVNTNLVDAD